MNTKPSIAFFGLGLMGQGMARRLLGAGYAVTVYNRDSAKAGPLAAAGAQIAATPAAAARAADVLISMVADDVASRAIWLGPEGALAGVRPGAVLIESSTLTVGCVRALHAAATAAGCELLDAPVTGSKVHAAAGELTFLVGGPATTLEQVRPVLAAMSRSIIHLGPSGSGAMLKLINNFLCGTQLVALAQAMVWIERSGLDRAKALEVLHNGAPGSPLVKGVSDRMVAADYAPNFLMRLMAKDLGYAIAESFKKGVPLSMATAALGALQAAINSGHGERDFSAVVEEYRKEGTPSSEM